MDYNNKIIFSKAELLTMDIGDTMTFTHVLLASGTCDTYDYLVNSSEYYVRYDILNNIERGNRMKHKILVTGSNQSIISDLFLHKNTSLDFITTSMRYDDMRSHIKYFQPDLFLYCMGTESKENNNNIAAIRKDLLNGSIPVGIICEPLEEGFKYEDFPGGVPKMLLQRPITATVIQQKILKFLDNPEDEQIATPELVAERNKYQPTKKAPEHTEDVKVNVPSSTAELLAYVDEELSNMEKEKNGTLRKQILVIDDAPGMLKLIKGLLDNQYDVATAVSGKLGRRFLQKKHVDLILLDYEMPEEDGPAVFRSFKEMPECENIPVVFLTGINEVSKIQKALSLMPQGYLLKPIEQKKLLAKIHELIG